MRSLLTKAILILITTFTVKSYAEVHSFRWWTNINYTDNFLANPNVLYGFLLEGRFEDQPGLFYQALVQNQLGYQTSETTQVWLGYTWIPSTVVGPTGRVNSNIHRIYQQFNASLYANSNYDLSSRSRVEERQMIGESGIGLMYRQLLNLSIPRLQIRNKYTPFLSEELFINLNKPV